MVEAPEVLDTSISALYWHRVLETKEELFDRVVQEVRTSGIYNKVSARRATF